MVATEDLQEQLENLVHKMDAEGLDYFLVDYGGVSMCPEEYGIRRLAQTARNALEEFTGMVKQACEDNGVEYEL